MGFLKHLADTAPFASITVSKESRRTALSSDSARICELEIEFDPDFDSGNKLSNRTLILVIRSLLRRIFFSGFLRIGLATFAASFFVLLCLIFWAHEL